jgi:lysylphosphatidylglycerol synthetase-like protein (DUF2156 family)
MKKLFSLLFLSFVIPHITNATTYTPLSKFFENKYTMGQGAGQALNMLFSVSIAVAAILAVIMIAIGGFKYMTSESVFNISGAKENIANAIIGLIIVLIAVILLDTINPEITNLNLFNYK